MATDLPLWTSDDCIKFVQQSMKTFRSKVSDDDMDRVISNLRSNYVTGSTLMKFSDEEWRELISYMGPARGMSLRKVSYEAFVFSVFSRNQEKTKLLIWQSVSS